MTSSTATAAGSRSSKQLPKHKLGLSAEPDLAGVTSRVAARSLERAFLAQEGLHRGGFASEQSPAVVGRVREVDRGDERIGAQQLGRRGAAPRESAREQSKRRCRLAKSAHTPTEHALVDARDLEPAQDFGTAEMHLLTKVVVRGRGDGGGVGDVVAAAE